MVKPTVDRHSTDGPGRPQVHRGFDGQQAGEPGVGIVGVVPLRGLCATSPVRRGPAAGDVCHRPCSTGLTGSAGYVPPVTPRTPYRDRRAPPSALPAPATGPGGPICAEDSGLTETLTPGPRSLRSARSFQDLFEPLVRRGRARSLRLLGLPAPPAGPWPSGRGFPLVRRACARRGPW